MSAATIAAIAALGAAAITALGAYIASSRRLSGKVATSEASSLWQESAAIRQHLAGQLEADRSRITALEARIALAEAHNNDLARENLELIRQLTAAETTIAELRGEVDELRRENEALRRTIRKWASDDDRPPDDRIAD